MKKILSLFISCIFMWGGVIGAVSADTATSTSTTTPDTVLTLQIMIQNLLQQASLLESQIAALQKDVHAVHQQAFQVFTQLHLGMSGDDVKRLQEILATDQDIFSHTYITGYYGPLTEKAVKHFQKHFGFEQVGFVGPHTLEKINELLSEHGIKNDEDLHENGLDDLGDGDSNLSENDSHEHATSSKSSFEHDEDNATSTLKSENNHE